MLQKPEIKKKIKDILHGIKMYIPIKVAWTIND